MTEHYHRVIFIVGVQKIVYTYFYRGMIVKNWTVEKKAQLSSVADCVHISCIVFFLKMKFATARLGANFFPIA